ncbi:hypothetical protein GCM10010435_87460 [Winogradskya consettensis]|uniref:Uncharacterized protein n=1 Tax=Winogradskya consettensis TaxID=113560 RepID=A0A919SXZ8_9ACTN|nr:hypothetical protein Aco04nite_72970 [Actinoplanes consettensis]
MWRLYAYEPDTGRYSCVTKESCASSSRGPAHTAFRLGNGSNPAAPRNSMKYLRPCFLAVVLTLHLSSFEAELSDAATAPSSTGQRRLARHADRYFMELRGSDEGSEFPGPTTATATTRTSGHSKACRLREAPAAVDLAAVALDDARHGRR